MEEQRERIPNGIFFLRVSAANLLFAHVACAAIIFAAIEEMDVFFSVAAATIVGVGLAANLPVFLMKRGSSVGWAIPHLIETFFICGVIPIAIGIYALVDEETKRWANGEPLRGKPWGGRWIVAGILTLMTSGLIVAVGALGYVGWLERPRFQVAKDDLAHVVIVTDSTDVRPVTERYETWGIRPDYSIWHLSDERGTPVITTELSSSCAGYCGDQIESSATAADRAGALHVLIHDDCPDDLESREELAEEFLADSPDALFVCQITQGGVQWGHVPTTRVIDSLGHLRYLGDGETVTVSELTTLIENAEEVLPETSVPEVDPEWRGEWCGISEGFLGIATVDATTPEAYLAAYDRMVYFLGQRVRIDAGGATVIEAGGQERRLGEVVFSEPETLSIYDNPDAPTPLLSGRLHLRRGDDIWVPFVVDGEVYEWSFVPAGDGRCTQVWTGVEPFGAAGSVVEWASEPTDAWPRLVLDQEIAFDDGRQQNVGSAFLVSKGGKLALATARSHLASSKIWGAPVEPREIDKHLESWRLFPHGSPDQAIEGAVRVTTYPDGFRDAIAIGINERPDVLPAQPIELRDEPAQPGETVRVPYCEFSSDAEGAPCTQRVATGYVHMVEPDRFSVRFPDSFGGRDVDGVPVIDANGELVGLITDLVGNDGETAVFYAAHANLLGLK